MRQQIAYMVFGTPIGNCGIAWIESGQQPLVLFALPEANPSTIEQRLGRNSEVRRSASAPPAIAEIVGRVCSHLKGQPQDFRDVALDLTSTGRFERQVYDEARSIPSGQTRTYGEIARAIGQPDAARAVGQALGRNPIPLIVPCHRVLAANGKLGGFSAPGGPATKLRLLEIEVATGTRSTELSFDFEGATGV